MMMNVTEQISAVRREVGTKVLEAGEAKTVTMTRRYDAPVDDVWDACTNRERIPRWFLPISGDLRLGGRYQFEGNAGGTIERCEPPRSLCVTWEFGPAVSWVELRLSEHPEGGTRFELEHIAHVDDHWEQFGPGAVGVGWDLGLLGLTRHFEDPAAARPPEGDPEWATSDEGRAYMTASSDAWCEAFIAAGASPDDARAAADRTTAFYTGAQEEEEAAP